MSNEFVHSVAVPRIYKITADIVRRVREDGASLKTLIYQRKHPVSVKNDKNRFILNLKRFKVVSPYVPRVEITNSSLTKIYVTCNKQKSRT